jgi:hypothetical protein
MKFYNWFPIISYVKTEKKKWFSGPDGYKWFGKYFNGFQQVSPTRMMVVISCTNSLEELPIRATYKSYL